VRTTEDQTVAAGHSVEVDPARWKADLEELMGRVAGRFGRVENAQVAVYLVYAIDAGHAVVDRELYLPRSWTDDPPRCRAVGVPEGVGFAPSPSWPRP
jgi:SRSO17 transposase